MSNPYSQKTVLKGEVKISENVIRSIAGVAALEVPGVVSLAQSGPSLLPASNPISIAASNDTVEITIRLILHIGHRLTAVAEQVQANVKENVQNMTGIIISKVHVVAAGISIDTE
ncbi:MAG: Asp23/Gls24 family envelope stress response protein [Oscillospiraceae bacterium]|nr:Asp23/Gls24 family envelope stress response protein [Oscillospiraceae bacterium]